MLIRKSSSTWKLRLYFKYDISYEFSVFCSNFWLILRSSSLVYQDLFWGCAHLLIITLCVPLELFQKIVNCASFWNGIYKKSITCTLLIFLVYPCQFLFCRVYPFPSDKILYIKYCMNTLYCKPCNIIALNPGWLHPLSFKFTQVFLVRRCRSSKTSQSIKKIYWNNVEK